MEKQQLTVKEALEQGYKMALSKDADYGIKLSELVKDPNRLDNINFFVASKETFKFSISEGAIENLFESYIENQDEVSDENGTLYIQLGNVNWKVVADNINKVFTTNYHSVTDIQLIP